MRFCAADLALLCGALLVAVAQGCSVAPASTDETATVDTRRLPRVNQMREVFVSAATTIYIARESVEKAGPLVAGHLTKAGWRQYSSAPSPEANPDQRLASFKRGQHAVSVFLTVEPGRKNQTSVQYAAVKLAHDLPFPADGEEIEFDPHLPRLRCTSRQPLVKLLSFFDAELAARGWACEPTVPGASRMDETGATAHYRSDQRPPLQLRLKRGDDGVVTVELEAVPDKAPVSEIEVPPSVD